MYGGVNFIYLNVFLLFTPHLFYFSSFSHFCVLIRSTVASCNHALASCNIDQLFYSFLIWEKVFKNWPSEICARKALKNFTWSILECFALYIATIFWETRKRNFYLHRALTSTCFITAMIENQKIYNGKGIIF